MPNLKCSIKLDISGGPSWSLDHTQGVEAYDLVDLIIPPNTSDQAVLIQPADTAKIALFAIQSSLYGAKISYKVSDGTTDTPALSLLGPQVLANGALGLFDVAPKILKLSNGHPAGDASLKARVQILIGRAAT